MSEENGLSLTGGNSLIPNNKPTEETNKKLWEQTETPKINPNAFKEAVRKSQPDPSMLSQMKQMSEQLKKDFEDVFRQDERRRNRFHPEDDSHQTIRFQMINDQLYLLPGEYCADYQELRNGMRTGLVELEFGAFIEESVLHSKMTDPPRPLNRDRRTGKMMFRIRTHAPIKVIKMSPNLQRQVDEMLRKKEWQTMPEDFNKSVKWDLPDELKDIVRGVEMPENFGSLFSNETMPSEKTFNPKEFIMENPGDGSCERFNNVDHRWQESKVYSKKSCIRCGQVRRYDV